MAIAGVCGDAEYERECLNEELLWMRVTVRIKICSTSTVVGE